MSTSTAITDICRCAGVVIRSPLHESQTAPEEIFVAVEHPGVHTQTFKIPRLSTQPTNYDLTPIYRWLREVHNSRM